MTAMSKKAPFIVPRPAGIPEAVERLTAAFGAIPGVGERTARKYALWFAMADRGAQGPAATLAQVLTVMRQHVHACPRCRAITDAPPERDHAGLCGICADPKREAGVLCVVATMVDMLAIERSGAYRGRYFVLGALVSPLNGIGIDELPIDALTAVLTLNTEVMLALPSSVDGAATGMVIASVLRGTVAKVTTLAQGMPHGGTVEHADQVTVIRAIEGRKTVE